MNEAWTEGIHHVSSQCLLKFRKIPEFDLPLAGVVNGRLDDGLVVCGHVSLGKAQSKRRLPH